MGLVWLSLQKMKINLLIIILFFIFRTKNLFIFYDPSAQTSPSRLGGLTRFYVIIHERFFVLFKLMNRRIMNQVNHLEKEKRNRLTGDGKDIQVTDTLKGKREMPKMELQGAI